MFYAYIIFSKLNIVTKGDLNFYYLKALAIESIASKIIIL